MEEDDYINADITSERGGDVDVQQSAIYNNDSVYSEIHEDHIYLTVIP